jgi:hypothetical protein
MSYTQALLAKIQDAEGGWPHFETPDFLQTLEDVAQQAFAKNSIEGHLAALLIWHQLCEEIAKLLLRDAQFFIQLSVHPAEIEFREKEKLMFGQILGALSETLSFGGKEEFLDGCRKLNTQRTELIHRLTRHSSLADIMARVVEVKVIYERVFLIFEEAHDGFRVDFHSFAKDVFLDLIEEEGEDAGEQRV